MRNFILISCACTMGWMARAQTLDPSLFETIDGAESTRRPFLFQEPNAGRFAVEISFGVNNYSWQPIEYEQADALVRQSLERNRPNFSSAQLNNTLWDMQYNGVLSTFRNSSGSYEQGLGPKFLRIRYRPMESMPVDFSVGFGRSVGLFYAKAQVQETGSTVGVNHSDLIASAFTDHYFHLREIFQNGLLELPLVPSTWKPLFIELGAGFSPVPKIKFVGSVSVLPNSSASAKAWQRQSLESGIAQSLTEISDVRASQQLALGCQWRFSSVVWGLEMRSFAFLGNIQPYTDLGASSLSMPRYFCMNFGYVW